MSEQREYDRLGGLLVLAEEYASAFKAWGFSVSCIISGNDVIVVVRGEVQK